MNADLSTLRVGIQLDPEVQGYHDLQTRSSATPAYPIPSPPSPLAHNSSVTGTTSLTPCSTPLTFTTPLPKDPTITRVNEYLKDIPDFNFFLRLSEPCRTVDIPARKKFGLANLLRWTVEVVCFDWFRRWMPEEVDLIMLDGSEQLDLPAWLSLLREHYRCAPAEAFGFPKYDVESWWFLKVGGIGHDAVHHRDLTTDNISGVLRLALALKDEHKARYVQKSVKVLYDGLCGGVPLDRDIIDIAPDHASC